MELGETIRFLRMRKMLRQNKLAEDAGISPQYLNQIENNKIDPKTIGENKIIALAQQLGVTPAELRSFSFSKSTEEAPSAEAPAQSVIEAFEIERKGWQSLEASLRDTIKKQDETIQSQTKTIEFLMSMLKDPQRTS